MMLNRSSSSSATEDEGERDNELLLVAVASEVGIVEVVAICLVRESLGSLWA